LVPRWDDGTDDVVPVADASSSAFDRPLSFSVATATGGEAAAVVPAPSSSIAVADEGMPKAAPPPTGGRNDDDRPPLPDPKDGSDANLAPPRAVVLAIEE
jgi:hypothetical protein